ICTSPFSNSVTTSTGGRVLRSIPISCFARDRHSAVASAGLQKGTFPRTRIAWRRPSQQPAEDAMPAIDSLRTLLIEQLKDLYDAEKRLTKAIPKLIKNATNDELKSALREHLEQTEEHVARVEQAFDELDLKLKAKTCAGMKGLVEEGDEQVAGDY